MSIPRKGVCRDVGETLIELIITIAIMGITIPAVIGAVLVAVDSSSQDRRIVQAQQLLTSWSETIAKANTEASYTSAACPLPLSYYAAGSFAPSPVLPSGFMASVASVDYWQASTSSYGGCAQDEGIRRIHLQIAVTASLYPTFTVDRYVLVRRPCSAC
jgi:type II secretory pathway pseudopilin PulG